MARYNKKIDNDKEGKGYTPKDECRDGKPTSDKKYRGNRTEPKFDRNKDKVLFSEVQHPSWYNKNGRLIQDNAKVPWSQIMGTSVVLNAKGNSNPIVMNYRIPGIVVPKYITGPGVAVNSSDGVNIAANILFQNIRKELSTYASYAQADVIMYILGFDDIASQYVNLVRLFGLINCYSAYNLYLPRDLILAGYGWDDSQFNEFKANLNNYRSRFNTLIYKASTIYCPVEFSIIDRHTWLFSNVFWDRGNNPRAQLYIPAKLNTYTLSETTNANGTELVAGNCYGLGIEELLESFDSCIEAYRNSDSMAKIASDMRRAFSDKVGSFKFAYVPENFLITPISPEYYLEQLHNADILKQYGNTTFTNYSLNITQDVNKNVVLWKPSFTVAHTSTNDAVSHSAFSEAWMAMLTGDKLLNVYGGMPTDDMLLEITRNKIIVDNVTVSNTETENTMSFEVVSCGADLIAEMDVVEHRPGLDPAVSSYIQIYAPFNNIEPGANNELADVESISRQYNFDYGPICYVASQLTEDTPGTDLRFKAITELDNWAVMSRENLFNLNAAVDTSVWSVPTMGLNP
nr:putative capsid [Marmot picobirnavirus]